MFISCNILVLAPLWVSSWERGPSGKMLRRGGERVRRMGVEGGERRREGNKKRGRGGKQEVEERR